MRTARYASIILTAVVIFAAAMSPRTGTAAVLDVEENLQEVSQWCWAAVSVSMLDYYGVESTQCAIANYTRQVATWHSYGTADCCVKPNGQCNYWNYLWGYDGSIEDILSHFGSIVGIGVTGTITLDECVSEIAANRPFIVRWAWTNGGGHFVIGHGIEADGTFYYMDPWVGEGLKISTYDWILADEDHEWTHTELMSSAPCECHAINACCDGCSIINEGGSCDADGDGCTVSDSCATGACVPGTAPDCTGATDQCNTGACQSTGADTFECAKDPTPHDGQPCNSDDDGCTQDDACQAGSCVPGPAPDCSGIADQCTYAICLSQGPDQFACVAETATRDGMECDDGSVCTSADICLDGICAGAAKDCSDNFACTVTGCDPQTGDCVAETDASLCDDGNTCTIDDCHADSGCVYAFVPDWVECTGPGFACFASRCEKLAPNDTFDTAAELDPGRAEYVDEAGIHSYLPVPADCFGTALREPDAFFRFNGKANRSYRLTVTPDEGVLVAAALWTETDDGPACVDGIGVTGTEAVLPLPDVAMDGITIQILVTSCENACAGTGVTLVVNEASGGDETPDTAESPLTDAWTEVWTDATADLSNETATIVEDFADDGAGVVESARDAAADAFQADYPSADTTQVDATDTSHPDSQTPRTDADVTAGEHGSADAAGDDSASRPDDNDGSGCGAGSRGALPGTAALIFLLSILLSLPVLMRQFRRDRH